jgi:hypothetical protein
MYADGAAKHSGTAFEHSAPNGLSMHVATQCLLWWWLFVQESQWPHSGHTVATQWPHSGHTVATGKNWGFCDSY